MLFVVILGSGSLLKQHASQTHHGARPQSVAADNHGLIYLPDDAFTTAFAQNATAEEQAQLAAIQRPIAWACISVPVGRPLWKDKPSYFLVAEQDRMIAKETQRFMAERMKAKQRSYPVDHIPSVTAPSVVVDIILEAVRDVTQSTK